MVGVEVVHTDGAHAVVRVNLGRRRVPGDKTPIWWPTRSILLLATLVTLKVAATHMESTDDVSGRVSGVP